MSQGKRHEGGGGIPIVQRGIVPDIYPYTERLASVVLGQKYIIQQRSDW
jgi:hypothetical protein